MNVKIAFIGASYLFVPKVVRDLALSGAFRGSELVIYDIVDEPAQVLAKVCRRISDELQANLIVRAAADRADALRNADFVILCISVGGRQASREDIEICRRHGCDHVIGDTIGPAALGRNLRMIPVVIDLAGDISLHCPQSLVINFTNPMSVTTATLQRHCKATVIGLCHGTGELLHFLGRAYGVEQDQVKLDVAGVNHFAFVTHIEISGQAVPIRDAMERLEQEQNKPGLEQRDPAWGSSLSYRYTIQVGRRLGMMTNNPDRHTAEFLPWFLRPSKKLFTMETADYDDRLRRWNLLAQKMKDIAGGREPIPDLHKPSGEMAEGVMLASRGDAPRRFVVNVPNRGAIAGLPDEAIVEVYKRIGGGRIINEPTIVLPPHLRNIIERLILIHEYTMQAAETANRELAMQALMLEANNHEFEAMPAMLDEMLAHNDRVARALRKL